MLEDRGLLNFCNLCMVAHFDLEMQGFIGMGRYAQVLRNRKFKCDPQNALSASLRLCARVMVCKPVLEHGFQVFGQVARFDPGAIIEIEVF